MSILSNIDRILILVSKILVNGQLTGREWTILCPNTRELLLTFDIYAFNAHPFSWDIRTTFLPYK